LILTNKDVFILSHVEDTGTRRLENLPSWVPDYSAQPKGVVPNNFKAGASVQGQQNPELNSRTICVSALFVDVISETAWGPEGHLTSAAHIHRLLEFLAGFPYSYSTEEDKFRVFKETLRIGTRGFPLLEQLAEVVAGMITVYKDDNFPADSFEKIIRGFKKIDQRGALPSWEKIEDLVNSLQECMKPSQRWREVPHPVIVATKKVLPFRFNGRIFRTKKDYMGTGYLSLKEGDGMWICPQAKTPFILRKQENGNYRFIGKAYAHGLMLGQLVESDTRKLERIRIE
jgi:hypothetical protein